MVKDSGLQTNVPDDKPIPVPADNAIGPRSPQPSDVNEWLTLQQLCQTDLGTTHKEKSATTSLSRIETRWFKCTSRFSTMKKVEKQQVSHAHYFDFERHRGRCFVAIDWTNYLWFGKKVFGSGSTRAVTSIGKAAYTKLGAELPTRTSAAESTISMKKKKHSVMFQVQYLKHQVALRTMCKFERLTLCFIGCLDNLIGA